MANTFTTFTGNGSNLDSGTIPFERFKETEIKVEVNDIAVNNFTIVDAEQADTAGALTNYSGGKVRFNNNSPNSDVCESSGAPKNGLLVLIYRSTDGASTNYTFQGGSTIKADHLNQALTQIRRLAYERQNQYIRHSQIGDKAVESVNIKDDTIVNADINSSAAIGLSKLATGALPSGITVASANIVNGTISPDDLGTNSVTTVKILDNNVTDAKISALSASKLTGALPALDGSNLTGIVELIDEDSFTTNSATKAPSQQSVKTYIGTTNYTKAEADSRFYNLASTEEIQSGETWVAADDKVATTKAIDNRVVDLIDDVGGFVALTNEAAIPAAHPEAANATTADRVGTILSIGVLSATYTPSGGTCTIPSGTLTNHSVNATITDCGSTTLSAGFGVLVETKAQTDSEYAAGPAFKFHRLTPKATEVTTVAGKATEITTVAGKTTEITTCHNKATEITTCHNKSTEITTCHTNATDIETVADNITNVSNFADLYQIASSAPGTDGGGNALAAGDLWFDSSSNKTLKVHNGTAFASVSPAQSVLDDISIVSGSLTRQEDNGSIADAISSGSGTGSLDTCATNITNINTFANVYRIASSAPSSSLDEGDLWYDSTANLLKYYNGTTWTVTAGAGLSSVGDDTSPELGGHLDCNDKNLTEVATVSGDNLQIDFGSIA